jgi:hypothetical protein
LQIEQSIAKAELEATSAKLPLKRKELQKLADGGGGHQISVGYTKSRLHESLLLLLSRGIDLKVPFENKTCLPQAYVDTHGSALTKDNEAATKDALESYHAYYRAI